MKSRHHIRWVVAALIFGAAALPFLVYATGTRTLGPYSHGGAAAFYAGFVADLVRLRPAALTLLLGPATLVVIWRLLVAYAGSWKTGPDGRGRRHDALSRRCARSAGRWPVACHRRPASRRNPPRSERRVDQ